MTSAGSKNQLMRPLYQLVPEILTVQAMADESEDGELSPEIFARLDALNDNVERKVQGCAQLALLWKYEAEAIEHEIARLGKMLAARKNAEARMKNYLKTNLEAMKINKVKTDTLTVSLRRNSAPRIEWVDNVEKIPEPYRRVVTTISFDWDAARRDWQEFGALPQGFTVEVGTHLRIT